MSIASKPCRPGAVFSTLFDTMPTHDDARHDHLTLLAVESRDGFRPEIAMTVVSNSDFARRMMLLARFADKFEPTVTYDPDGDCIEFIANLDPFYAEQVDDLVTVYISQETNEVIGGLITGVTSEVP
jgi:hypothetical protein